MLFDTDISPFEQVNVALDLETTGLDSNRHQILEIGAVRFRGDEVIETYQTLVNPGVPIPEFIQRLTHITPQQVKRAPFFSSVASEIEEFLGADPIIGSWPATACPSATRPTTLGTWPRSSCPNPGSIR